MFALSHGQKSLPQAEIFVCCFLPCKLPMQRLSVFTAKIYSSGLTRSCLIAGTSANLQRSVL